MKNRRILLTEKLHDYFSFTRWQRRSLVVLIILIIGFAVLPALYPYYFPPKSLSLESIALHEVEELVARRDAADSAYRQQWTNEASWREPKRYDNKRYDEKNYSNAPAVYFPFDPNTASEEDFVKLGLRPKTAATIINYRNKGGKFRKPEDLLKIYSISPEHGKALLPYVRIAEANNAEKPRWDSAARATAYTRPARPSAAPIDINLADTSAFIALPGIGSKLAFRIINFREKLGGFVSVAQVGETFGLPDSTFQLIKGRLLLSAGFTPATININTATAERLKVHPYFRWNMANAVVNYRLQHGPYKTVDDLRKIVLVEEEWLQKIRPYLSAE